MSWLARGRLLTVAVVSVLAAAAALALATRRRGEVWHTLADQN